MSRFVHHAASTAHNDLESAVAARYGSGMPATLSPTRTGHLPKMMLATFALVLAFIVLSISQRSSAQDPNKPLRLNPGEWLQDAPYWMRSIPGDRRVAAKLSVTETGQVTDCTITRPSGVNGFDAVVCFLLETNARYEPAKDAAGQPVASQDQVSFTIKPLPPLQVSYPAEPFVNDQEGTTVLTLQMKSDGTVEKCTVKKSSRSKALDDASCDIADFDRWLPPKDSSGKYTAFTTERTFVWKIPD
jgi:TonB family protein